MGAACCSDGNELSENELEDQPVTKVWQVKEIQLAVIALTFLLLSFVLAPFTPKPVSTTLELLATAIAGYTFIPSTLKKLPQLKIGVGTLMTIATIGALLLGKFEEAAMLTILFSIAEGLEEYSMTKAQQSLKSLLSLIPDTAIVRRNGIDETIPSSQVRLNDIMIVKSGSRISTDGVVISGHSSVDNSAITGEAVPVEITEGDMVYAASINGTGVLEVKATATASDNSLSKVVKIVETAQSQKGTGQRLADKIARPLVPSILALSLLVAVIGSALGDWHIWVERALVVLVAASPCALALSVPITVVSAIGAASKQGIIIKGGAALENLSNIGIVALDKTGTITENKPQVIKVISRGMNEEKVLAYAAALETQSEHPLASAIINAATTTKQATNVSSITGAGITGTVDDKTVRVGKPDWIVSDTFDTDIKQLQEQGATVVLVEVDNKVAGIIAVRDELRQETPAVIQKLKNMGKDVTMLTGDNEKTANTLASKAGITSVYANLKPADKAMIISELESKNRTSMVGDGVNDAPALATSTVGVAMGTMGADVAIQTADVALMGNHLQSLVTLFKHANRAKKIMIQNIILSLLLIAILIPLALFGVLGLTAVVAIHEAAEVLVILNGLRASKIKK